MPRTPGNSGAGRGDKPSRSKKDQAAPRGGAPDAHDDKAAAPPWMPDPALVKAMQGSQRAPTTTRSGPPAAGRVASEAPVAPKPRQRPHTPPPQAVQVPPPTGTTPAYSDPQAAREATRYDNPIASREAILQLLTDADGPLTVEELAAQLGLSAPDRSDALSKRVSAMVRDGQLLQNRKGAYAPAKQLDLVAGTVIANPEGFGFLRPDAGAGDDLFLPPFEMRKVTHGDRALASVTGVDRRGRREGAIVEVLERRVTRLIGRFTLESGISYVVPDDRRIQRNVQIPVEERLDAKHGQLVVAEIVHAPDVHRPPIGRVLAVLGDKLTASLAVEAAIHGHDIPNEFPPEVLAQATAVPLEVDAATAAARVDLRQLPLLTIDGEDAKDFDDAVYCEPNKDGFRLIVAIADVSHYVRPGTPLDEEAIKRATSVYFPGFVVPMLPETLSNGICSLKPKVDRLCFVCDMQVGRDGQVGKARFYEAVMNSHVRLTYTQVWNAVGAGVPDEDRDQAQAFIGKQMPQVLQLHALYYVLDAARKARGAIEFESSEVRFVLGPQGEVTQAGMLQRNDAHKLIEECMIAANVEAARFLLEKGIPAPYRDHDKPPEAKFADLLEFLKEFKLRLPPWGKVHPRDFRALLDTIRDRPDAALLESVVLRSQSLAVYAPENIGHFGLALEAYAHFTSPIRRYADLLVHRAIKHALAGGTAASYLYSAHTMASLSVQCSERSRRADDAQREVDDRYRAAWMEQHVGSQFDGTISGVTSFGLFVELDGSKVNGLVHVTQLPNDYYHFDPIRKTLAGGRTERTFRLGDRARIVVLKASLEERKIDFRLVIDDGAGGDAGDVVAKTPTFSPRGAKGRQQREGAVKAPGARGKPAKRPKSKY